MADREQTGLMVRMAVDAGGCCQVLRSADSASSASRVESGEIASSIWQVDTGNLP